MFNKFIKYTLLITITLWLGGYASFIVHLKYQPIAKPHTKTDAIVVLTGGHSRIKTGLSLFSNGLSTNLFITGVHKDVKKSDITNINDCCITLGHKARTTIENALETKEWIKQENVKSIRLVTSAYHMKRAFMEFNNTIPNIEIIPHPVKENENQFFNKKFWKITFSEYNKTLFRITILTISNKG